MKPAEVGGRRTYLIGAGGSPLVKIGVAVDPVKRLTALQTGSPARLMILWVHPSDVERDLHNRFASCRVHGEWFDLSALGDPIDVVANAVAELQSLPLPAVTVSPPKLDVRAHLATHGNGEWCETCEMWPHEPVFRPDGWCARCMAHSKDHDDSIFRFSWRRLEEELAA
ncbi:GIY-YIG nuclease family protein [Streptomyces sp. BR123]|uniref:GIY-YIG nuclease family protein n=1 Tax=Streptomyces sp. BR123 TaxID=2749828 RepID=UPI0015C4240A|nr:GIY-YIG nuclease family protein [Streptomyces sp. BR123]NXY98791.1 GIY-YIG nuclease family protein [Streptomyces sp. BR123]